MRKLAGPALLFLLCVGFYWRLTLTSQYTLLDSPDLAYLDIPRLQFQATAFRHSQFPLWDPNQWVGQPYLGQVTGAAYPANWLLSYFPFREGKLNVDVIHWYLVLIHFQAALFCYFLCRDWKRSRAASVLGGLVFSLGGFFGDTDWPQLLNGAVWLPLIVLFLFRALRGKRALFSAALSGSLLGLAWFSGHHEVPIYTVTAVAGIWVAALIVSPSRWEVAKLALAAGLATTLIAAFQILPAFEYAALAKRWVGSENDPIGGSDLIPYLVHQNYSWNLTAMLGIVTPQTTVHINPFIGIVAFSLAMLGVYHGWRLLPQVRLAALLALAGLLLAAASQDFLHGVLYGALPVFGKARVPARALVLFGFGVAPLVAYGLDALRRRSSLWLHRTIWILTAVGGALYAVLAAWQPPASLSITALTALLGAGLFAAYRARSLSPIFAAGAITLLVLVEIGNVTGTRTPSRIARARAGYLDRLFHHFDLAEFLRAQPQPVRVEASSEDIPYNFGDWHGIPALGGFAASATSNVIELERHKPVVQDLLGINYYIARTPPRPGLEPLMEGTSGLRVYRNPSALPRAWIVHSTRQIQGYDYLRIHMASPEFQPRTEAIVQTAPPTLESCSGEESAAIVPSGTPNQVHIDVTAACRGLVILSDTYFPGWQARVDGRPVEILETFGALRGVVVDKGSHRIEYAYRPSSAIAGGSLTALGLVFLFWTHWKTRIRAVE